MKLRIGLALASAVDETNVIVTKAPDGEVTLTCGGAPMIAKGAAVEDAVADPAQMNGSVIGKRYVDAAGTFEVLCTKAGKGSLAVDGTALTIAEPKPLPASD